MKKKKELTVWTTAIPLYFELIALNSINIMDVYFMSLVSDKAVTALGACTQIIMVFTLLIRTLCGGAGSVAAQHIGGKNRVQALLAFMYAMVIAIVGGTLFSAILYFGRSYFMSWMGLTGEALGYATQYLSIIGPAFFLLALRTGYTTIVAVKGKSSSNLICAILANFVNILFNCIFVLGWFGLPKLGVVGVALSTTISLLAYLFLIAFIAHKKLFIRFVFPKNIIERLHQLSRRVLGIAIPNCGDLLSYMLFQVVIVSIVIRIDQLAAAAYTYVHQIMAVVMIWSYSVAQGQAILTAHLVGAGKHQIAQQQIKLTILRCLAFAIPVTFVFYTFADQIINLFTDNPAIKTMAASALLAYLGIEIGRAFNVTLSLSLAAAGDAKYPAILGFIFNWLIGVPAALFFGMGLEWGLLGALMGIAFDELIRSPLNYLRLTSGRWQK